ncbi:MAG TPA: BON domain-containing protein [Nitrospira sp.]|nr:BON domain-containing protein [Nitrospira sp.]
MIVRRLSALLASLSFCVPAGFAADDAPKEPSQVESTKKKPNGDGKQEGGKPGEEKPAKAEEPPAPKPEEQAKKAVTSPNLTIKLALMAEPTLFPYEIEVEMDNRKAVLTGTVSTEEEKAKAAEVVRRVDGVESVVNKLTVSPALRASLTKKQDEMIAHFVRDRLARSETLKAVGFDVKAENGVVRLSGKTRFQVIALEAAEAARQVPGVRAVDTTAVQIVAKD